MTTPTEQPEALRPSKFLQPGAIIPVDIETTSELFAELRSLHAENEELSRALTMSGNLSKTLLAALEADREAMEEALAALIQATGMCAEGTSTRRDVDAAIKALDQRVGES